MPLVFVNALDLDVEQCCRINLDVEAFADQPRQHDLVVVLDAAELLLEGAIAGAGLEKFEFAGIVEHGFAAGLAQQTGQPGVGQHQPAAEGDAVGLVGDAGRIEMIEIVEHGLLHQIGMHRRDAVDAVRSDERQLPHAYPAAGPLVDQGYRGLEIVVAGTALVG